MNETQKQAIKWRQNMDQSWGYVRSYRQWIKLLAQGLPVDQVPFGAGPILVRCLAATLIAELETMDAEKAAEKL